MPTPGHSDSPGDSHRGEGILFGPTHLRAILASLNTISEDCQLRIGFRDCGPVEASAHVPLALAGVPQKHICERFTASDHSERLKMGALHGEIRRNAICCSRKVLLHRPSAMEVVLA